MLQQSWTLLYFYIISILNGVKSIELAVSSKNALFFLNESHDVRKQIVPSAILALGTDHYGKLAVIQDARNSDSQLKMTSYSSVGSTLNHSSNYFPLVTGVTKVLPDPFNDHEAIFVANKSQLILEQDQTLTKVYEGQSILDVSIDYCQEALFIVDKGSLFRSNISTKNENNDFKTFLPYERHVQLVTSQIYLARNLKISHSDGFVIKNLLNGQEICHSDPTSSYNIRAISLDKNQLFLLDALNSIVWNLDLVTKTNNATCDLNLWKRVPRNEQLLDLVILNRSIDCISTLYHQKNHQYLNGQQDTSTTIAYQINPNQNPCLNFCFHDGECMVTTLNKPVCHCQQNFTGTRCQVDVCHNYCLNNGICNVSTAFEALKCQCPPGFSGSRCQQPEPEIAIPTTFNYEHAFLVSSSLCVVFIFILLAVCIILLRKKQEKGPDFARFEKISKEPEIVKKNGRTRVFSTSSNSDGKRSRNASKSNKSRESEGAVNEAFGNTAQDNCVDDQGHMCQALISDDGVVLDLEDCCQMTVCDRPCIEATFRKPTSRKKKHNQTLLQSNPDNELY